jgi:hypothetical protein
MKMNHRSRLDPTRNTVGYIYRQAQLYGEKQIITGDMNFELRKSLADDINDAIKEGTKVFEGRQFYITVYEKRDLAMKNAFHRELSKTKYRPYPEADTLVFKVQPYIDAVYFCWELPQRAHMINELNNPDLYDAERLMRFRRWENMQLEYYGFIKNDEGHWKENPLYRGDTLMSSKEESAKVSMHKIDSLVDGPHGTF